MLEEVLEGKSRLRDVRYISIEDLFRYDEQSWRVGEPADWNLVRRMMLASARMTDTEDIVGTMYSVSYTNK